jgi:hypothetical protein
MPALSWTDYVGAVAGVVGMATGIVGAVMGFVAYRRTNQNKAIDMRVALQKDLPEVRESIGIVRESMASAAGSRRNVLAARGLAQSGAMVVWEQTLEAGRAQIEKIAASIRSEGANFASLSLDQLESETVAIHKIKTSLSTLVEKYRDELAADHDARRQIGQQHTAIAAARISQNK